MSVAASCLHEGPCQNFKYIDGGLISAERALDRHDDLERLRIDVRRKPPYDAAIPVDEELLEVPVHVPAATCRRTDKELIERAARRPVHVLFSQHRETDLVGGRAESRNLFGSSRLLAAELVARRAEHYQPSVAKVTIYPLERPELGRVSALAGDVHHEDHLPSKPVGRQLTTPQQADLYGPSHGCNITSRRVTLKR